MEGTRLPVELYRPIVERVDSKPALCNLSRVCRVMNEETNRVLYSHFASHPRDVPIRLSRPLNPPPSHSKLGRYLKSLELDLVAIAMEDHIRMDIDPDTQDPPIWSLYADLLKRCHNLVSLTLVDIPDCHSQNRPTLDLLKLIPPTIEHVSVVLSTSATRSGAILLEFLERQPNLQSIHVNKPMQLNFVARSSPVHLRSLRKISAFSPMDAHVLAKICISTNLKAMIFSMATTFKDLQWAQETLENVEWLFMPHVMFPAAWDTVKPFKNIRFFGIFQFISEEVSPILLHLCSFHQMFTLTPIVQEDEGRRVLAELPTLESVSIMFPPGPDRNDKGCQAIQAIRTADKVIAGHPRIRTAYMVQSSMRTTDLCILLQKDESHIGWKLSRFKEGSTIRDLWADL